ncbi:MAG: hypothetical protein CMK89_06955 [Pseudomonadales bacterium]|nr:hypothetical protein [Pseudomonadales bacterium]RLU04139.1 MAG: DUF2306 domain-containing protein [Ketobacter sp.]
MADYIHLAAACWVLVAGGLQIALKKGTSMHRRLGWSWMLSMLVVALSSFWITGFMDLLWGYSPIHLLSLWVIFCVLMSVQGARNQNLRRHILFAVGAYLGTVGATLGALAPGRMLHGIFFG